MAAPRTATAAATRSATCMAPTKASRAAPRMASPSAPPARSATAVLRPGSRSRPRRPPPARWAAGRGGGRVPGRRMLPARPSREPRRARSPSRRGGRRAGSFGGGDPDGVLGDEGRHGDEPDRDEGGRDETTADAGSPPRRSACRGTRAAPTTNAPGHDRRPPDSGGQHGRRGRRAADHQRGHEAPEGGAQGAVAEHGLQVLRDEDRVAHDREHADDLDGHRAGEAAVGEERQVEHRRHHASLSMQEEGAGDDTQQQQGCDGPAPAVGRELLERLDDRQDGHQ